MNMSANSSAAAVLNAQCWCIGTDLPGLRATLGQLVAAGGVTEDLATTHPHLFADVPLFITGEQHRRIVDAVAALHRVMAMPAWREAALAGAPALAAHDPGNPGSFLGVDFHLDAAHPAGPDTVQLIELNTNPGGAVLNVLLGQAQQACCAAAAAAFPDLQNFAAAGPALLDLFAAEWRAAGRSGLPQHLVICDADPVGQYLYPEFVLYQRGFAERGIAVSIADPGELRLADGRLRLGDVPVDMVYNRLTDFALADAATAVLAQALRSNAVVVTPHPRAHALFASKRNLVRLADDGWLAAAGVDAGTRALLAATVPATEVVDAARADELWARRRELFFKPLDGFGGRGAYRGDKLTRRVFAEILAGGYIAQRIVAPSERTLAAPDAAPMKVDVRAYAYEGEVLLLAARLYRGQTTNFRTPGGGFAPVLRAEEGCDCGSAAAEAVPGRAMQ